MDHMSKGMDITVVLNYFPHNTFSHEQLFWSDHLKTSKMKSKAQTKHKTFILPYTQHLMDHMCALRKLGFWQHQENRK